ncbi:hypothetical protein [Ralstonia sp.]|uniref:hypothetical protein n=1 Tax=Ralstonia sp. TaxID=54061 RepID=UPI001A4A3166|nr:hypothetical protein [Ralstonia sp.]MBL4780588.1 hypothetical protein [Ralstonia sp.]
MIALLALTACAGIHSNPLSLNQQQLQVIGLPQFVVSKRIDIRRDNPIYAVIGLSAKVVQQVVRESKRIKYQDANPELLQYALTKMRKGIKHRLRKLGYRVVDLDMTYWQAQKSYRKKDSRTKHIDALFNVQIKRFGYASATPYKPYRPGMVLTADLYATHDRKLLSSHVYNVGYDREYLSHYLLQVGYISHIHVEDRRYFYKNFDDLMDHAKDSSQGLKFIVGVAAESVAGDLKKTSRRNMLATR